MLLRPVDDFELGSGFEAAEEDGGTLQGNTVWKIFYKPVYNVYEYIGSKMVGQFFTSNEIYVVYSINLVDQNSEIEILKLILNVVVFP